MKYVPFLLVLSSPANAVLSSVTATIADTVTRINAAITEVNANPTFYGYATTPALPSLPTVPTGALGIHYTAAHESEVLESGFTHGFSQPDHTCDALIATAAVAAIVQARQNLDTVTTQPANSSVAATAASSFAITAAGKSIAYLWQESTDAGVTWANLSNGGGVTNSTTATLGLAARASGDNGKKYRCRITTAQYQFYSGIATQTVT